MIGRLVGRVVLRDADCVLLDVGGVGYEVHCSERTLAGLPPAGEMALLHTELVVREDLMQLLGFASRTEREWHRALTSVQGVGAKAALAILGTLSPEALGRAIALGDVAAVRAAPGVGPKLAQRVVNELQGKAATLMALGGQPGDGPAAAPAGSAAPAPMAEAAPAPGAGAASAEALSALVNLGYGQSEAVVAVAEAARAAPQAATPDLIRAALRLLAPKG